MSPFLIDFSCKLPVKTLLDEGYPSFPSLAAVVRSAGFDNACISVEGEERDLAIIPALAKAGFLVGLPYNQIHLYEEYADDVDYIHYTISNIGHLEALGTAMAKLTDIGLPFFAFIAPARNHYSAHESPRSAQAGLLGDDGLLETISLQALYNLSEKYQLQTLALGVSGVAEIPTVKKVDSYLQYSVNLYSLFSAEHIEREYLPWMNVSPPVRDGAGAGRAGLLVRSGKAALSSGHTFLPTDVGIVEFDQTQIGADTYTKFLDGLALQKIEGWQQTNKELYRILFPDKQFNLVDTTSTFASQPLIFALEYAQLSER